MLAGSSRGRGTRCAVWFEDVCKQMGGEEVESVILVGGLKGWAGAGEKFTDMIDGYVEEYWKEFA